MNFKGRFLATGEAREAILWSAPRFNPQSTKHPFGPLHALTLRKPSTLLVCSTLYFSENQALFWSALRFNPQRSKHSSGLLYALTLREPSKLPVEQKIIKLGAEAYFPIPLLLSRLRQHTIILPLP